ncbi:MAG: M20/M25/M40 family metallo-hydrolase [Promethearchaeota archaeon]
MKSLDKIGSLITESNKEFIENELQPFLRIPSNTLNKEGTLKAKNYLTSYISEFSENINEIEGVINPLILARVKGKIKESLLIYMMYDTQPINKEEKWISAPFGAEKKVLPPPLDELGECIITRGAYNSKTPLICFLNVIKKLKEMNELPISLLLLFDGEEEMGSLTLLNFLGNNKEMFKNCIDAYYPATKQDLDGTAILKLGYKGILSLTIKVYSKNKEPHSGFSGMIPNPATDLVSVLNKIYSNNRFQIESLKTRYILTEEESSLIDSLVEKIDIEKIKRKAGIIETKEKDPRKTFVSYLFNPTFNISTLKSGFLDEGIKNMVANEAICNIDIRFAHSCSIDEIFKEIKAKIDNYTKNTRSHCELIKNIGYEGSRVEKDSILVKSLIKSAKMLEIPTEIWPISAAAAPLSKIQKELGINFITGGLGIGGFAHAPNEFIQIDSILNTRLGFSYFLKIYSNNYMKK